MTRYGQTMAEALQGINEKLKPSDGAGAYVKDFRKSDAPQFKGKSDKQLQKMAVAAYLDDKEENAIEIEKLKGAHRNHATKNSRKGFVAYKKWNGRRGVKSKRSKNSVRRRCK